jgi:tetratricopeptide (TPR) repeat protein
MRWISLCLAGLLFFPTFAQAKDDTAKAASRALLKQGNERLDKEKFDQALEKFEQAYARFPSPKIFFSMGQALRGLRRNADALRAFQHFVDEVGEISEEVRKEAQTNITELSVLVNQELAGQAREYGQAAESAGAREQLLAQGLALRGLGRNVDAMLVFERFLAGSKDATVQDQEDRKEAQDNIAKLTPLVGRVEITSNRPGATAVMDGQALPAAPLPRSLWVAPGATTR